MNLVLTDQAIFPVLNWRPSSQTAKFKKDKCSGDQYK